MRLLLRYLLLGTITAAIAPVGIHAQPAPAGDKVEVAKRYVDAGLAAKDAGDYDTAITFYTKAYALVPNPLLIFNIAEANRLAGRPDQAVKQYADYLAKDPRGIRAQAARDNIKQIEAAKADEVRKAEEARKAQEMRKAEEARNADNARKAEQARKAEEARKIEAARAADESRRAEDARRARELEARRNAQDKRVADASAPGATSQVDRPELPGRTLRLSGIAVGSAGVVTLGIGIGFGLHARSLSDQVSRTYDPAKVRAGERADKIAITGMVGGALLVAGGAALWWWGYTQGHAERVAVAPVVSDQIIGLVVTGPLP